MTLMDLVMSAGDSRPTTMWTGLYLVLSFNAALLLWRLWRFTIRPFFHPYEPKELPYWIPCHAWGLLSDFQATLEHGRQKFTKGDVTEIHSIHVAGSNIYVVSSASDASYLVRTLTDASFDDISRGIHLKLGISQQCVDRLYAYTTDFLGDEITAKRPLDAITECHKKQLSPGREELGILMNGAITPYIDSVLSLDNAKKESFVLESSGDTTTISLLKMCEEILMAGVADAFLGLDWYKSNDEWKRGWIIWERLNWKVLVGLPGVVSRDATDAAATIVDSIVKYLRLPQTEKAGGASSIREIEAIMRRQGFKEEDMARILFLQLWAYTGNNYKLIFWTISHIAHNPGLLASLRQEILPAARGDSLDETYIAGQCPELNSLIDEILRMTVVNGLVRDIIAPTLVGGKTLMPGNRVLVPYRPHHFDSKVWGEDVDVMNSKRFVRNPKLQSSKSYHPFGSGAHLCPGRFFARRSAAYLIALLVYRYDFALKNDRTGFPRANTSKPGAGVQLPQEGEDVILNLTRRTVN